MDYDLVASIGLGVFLGFVGVVLVIIIMVISWALFGKLEQSDPAPQDIYYPPQNTPKVFLTPTAKGLSKE